MRPIIVKSILLILIYTLIWQQVGWAVFDSLRPLAIGEQSSRRAPTLHILNQLLHDKYGLSDEILTALFGEEVKIQCLILTDEDFKKLDTAPELSILRLGIDNLLPYEDMRAFTLRQEHRYISIAIKMALGLAEELPLPLVIVRENPSIIQIIHETTHAMKSNADTKEVQNRYDYVTSIEETEACLNSILIFRYLYPEKSFYDFEREHEGVARDQLSDEAIKTRIRSGRNAVLVLNQLIWEDVTQEIREKKSLTQDLLSKIRKKVLKRMSEQSGMVEKIYLAEDIAKRSPRKTEPTGEERARGQKRLEDVLQLASGAIGTLEYHTRLYSGFEAIEPSKSAMSKETELEIISVEKTGGEVWIQVNVLKPPREGYYGLPPAEAGKVMWIKVTSDPHDADFRFVVTGRSSAVESSLREASNLRDVLSAI